MTLLIKTEERKDYTKENNCEEKDKQTDTNKDQTNN